MTLRIFNVPHSDNQKTALKRSKHFTKIGCFLTASFVGTDFLVIHHNYFTILAEQDSLSIGESKIYFSKIKRLSYFF